MLRDIGGKALTPAEIVEAYNSGKGMDLSSDMGEYKSSENLLAYFKFDEGAGDVTLDNSGNGLSGTIYEATWNVETPISSVSDLDFQGSSSDLTLSWSATDALSDIADYQYALGSTAGGTEIKDWTSTGTNTQAFLTELSLSNGGKYYGTVKATDKAGNISDPLTGDGIVIDLSPPETGNVYDGPDSDISYSHSGSEVTANWEGFSDELSGIFYYEFAIGSSVGGTEVLDYKTVGNVPSHTESGLTLLQGEQYYVSIMAIDAVGNVSDPVSSDGFYVDMYPGAPAVLTVNPEPGTRFSLSDDSQIKIHFSEPVVDYSLDISSNLGSDLETVAQQDADSLVVTVKGPLTSLDTLNLSLFDILDKAGLTSDTTHQVSFYTALMADYNGDLKVNVEDLSQFVSLWPGLDLGPVTGDVPNLRAQLDGVANLRDVGVFTRMWHWSHSNTTILARTFPNVGDDIDVEQSPQSLMVSIPDEAIAGEVVVQYQTSSTDITLNGGESADRILINNKDAELGQIIVDFGYLKPVDKKQLIFDTKYENDPTITLSYIFYGRNNSIISMGTREMDLTAVPDEFSLHQNYPNPFNPTTTILYDLPEAAMVHLVIYDVLGRQVRTLVNQDLTAGYHKAVWDATDDMGRPLSGGLYIYRIQAGGYSKTMKMVLLK